MSLYIESGSEDDGNMEVEPGKSVAEWLLEWTNYYMGRGEKPTGYMTVQPPMDPAIEAQQALRRKEAEDAVERELRRRVHSSAAVHYIGDDTQPQRENHFKKIHGTTTHTVRGTQTLKRQPWTQNPFSPTSWRSREQLARLNDPLQADIHRASTAGADVFKPLYREASEGIQLTSYSRPEIFALKTKDREAFAEVMYGDNTLFMKLTPFIDADGYLLKQIDIDQIYNEIKIAYFLNELVYGYTNVLSVHFMVMVDWFQTSREKLGLYRDPLKPSPMDTLYSQVTISEYASTDVTDFLIQNASLGTLRAVIFQVLHALETAWLTNQFVHYDLHLGNIVMKETNYSSSPFQGRNFLYNRNGVFHWYALDAEHLAGHLVKIIDYGFSRIQAPSTPKHISSLSRRHLHNQVIGLDWQAADMQAQRPNQFADVRMFLLGILSLPLTFWARIPLEDKEEFYRFTEDILDFEEMNRIVRKSSRGNEQLAKRGGILTPANITDCPLCVEPLRVFGGYARKHTTSGRSASDTLDHPFFNSLRRTAAPELSLSQTRPGNDVVVSFFTQTGEEQMLLGSLATSSSSAPIRCSVCRGVATQYNREKEGVHVSFCGPVCAEFRYIFDCKTVFR